MCGLVNKAQLTKVHASNVIVILMAEPTPLAEGADPPGIEISLVSTTRPPSIHIHPTRYQHSPHLASGERELASGANPPTW